MELELRRERWVHAGRAHGQHAEHGTEDVSSRKQGSLHKSSDRLWRKAPALVRKRTATLAPWDAAPVRHPTVIRCARWPDAPRSLARLRCIVSARRFTPCS